MNDARPRWYPWRSAALGWLVAGAFLALGVPLFLRMPLWCDATLYAVAAREISTGGVHYRDVFDTNPPGFVWALAAVRGTLGTSQLAVRAVDLLIVVLVVAGLLWWARRAGASGAAVAWCAAACAAFYLFVPEFCHAQRDVWMMLPAGAAILLRMRRGQQGQPHPPTPQEPNPPTPFPKREGGAEPSSLTPPSLLGKGVGGLGSAALEGLIWGAGCWIKPHLFLIALAVWFVTNRRFGWRDHVAVFVGGALAGVAGAVWLVSSGAWPHFLDIWRTWNADYFGTVLREQMVRFWMQPRYFPPYSVAWVLAVPLACMNLWNKSDAPDAFYRRVLGAVYLAWFLLALFLQRPFHYVHVPDTLLMLAVFAANRWAVSFVLVLLPALAALVFALTGAKNEHLPPHPAFDLKRSRWWGGCFQADPPRELHTGVAMYAPSFSAIDPAELGPVEDYLRGQNVRDFELIAWHDSPHALYLDLGIRPGFRFMHVGTAAGLGKWQEAAVLRELQAALPRARFVVSDVHRLTERFDELNDTDADALPKLLAPWQRKEFPFNQPVVYRSPGGRYLVHRITNPVTSARIPWQLEQEEDK